MAYGSRAVEWNTLDEHTYEHMVAVTLSYIHPGARRTDGAGGDGGKDVYLPTAAGRPEVFQLKCFTARMSNSRWQQVKRSLQKAATLNPVAWHLVLPIDFTPGEEKRFSEITAPYAFPCDYMGLSWLDARMAEFPVVPKYFLQSGEERVLELLREFQAERAALSSAPDLVNRLQQLAARADQIDPFYHFDFSVQGGSVSLALRPKYPGAETDRPITATVEFAWTETPEAHQARSDLDAAVRYGAAAHIPAAFVHNFAVDAPAGLGGEHGSGEFLIKGSDIAGPPVTVNMVLLDPDDRRIASLPLRMGPRSVGMAGFQATATDPSGCLRCRLRVDGQTMNLNLAYEMELPPRCMPAQALPTLRFLTLFGAPNRFQLHIEGAGDVMPAVVVERPPLVASEYVELVAMFERVQSRTHTFFDLPETLTNEDYGRLLEADRLLSGERVRGRWQAFTCTMGVGAFIRLAEANGIDVFAGGRMSQFIVQDIETTIAGHAVPLGLATRILHSAELESPDAVKAAFETDPSQEKEIKLKPGANNDSSCQLGEPEGFDQSRPSA